MAPVTRSHYHKYSMAEENNEYRIVDYELSYVNEVEYEDGVLVEECDVFKAHFSMFYSIDKFISKWKALSGQTDNVNLNFDDATTQGFKGKVSFKKDLVAKKRFAYGSPRALGVWK